MLAAGKGLEPFWNIYQQHFGEGAAEAVAAHLDRMRVGNLVPSAAELAEQDAAVAADDPFAREPAGRHPSLKVWSKRAFNAESPTNLIGDTVRARPGRLSALSFHQHFPMKIHFVWGFCVGAQGA